MPISGFDMLAFIYFIFIIIVTIKIMYYSELNDLTVDIESSRRDHK